MKIEVYHSDLLKIFDAIAKARDFHVLRDEMNAKLHMSECRYSPLTSTLVAETERLTKILWPEEERG